MLKQREGKLGIALGGGGPRGIAHVGVLKALGEVGIKPDMLAGTSVGSLVGALYVFGVPLDAVRDYAFNMTWWTVTKPTLSRYGLASNEKMRGIINHFLGDKCIEDAPVPFAVVATDITTGEKIVMSKGDLAHAIMASSCIPGVFTPVTFGDRLLVDGGLSENVPLSVVRDLGADIVVGVDLMTTRTPRAPQGVIDVVMNAFDIALQHTMRPKTAADVLIRPDMSGFIKATKPQLEILYEEGYKAGKEAVERISQLLYF